MSLHNWYAKELKNSHPSVSLSEADAVPVVLFQLQFSMQFLWMKLMLCQLFCFSYSSTCSFSEWSLRDASCFVSVTVQHAVSLNEADAMPAVLFQLQFSMHFLWMKLMLCQLFCFSYSSACWTPYLMDRFIWSTDFHWSTDFLMSVVYIKGTNLLAISNHDLFKKAGFSPTGRRD